MMEPTVPVSKERRQRWTKVAAGRDRWQRRWEGVWAGDQRSPVAEWLENGQEVLGIATREDVFANGDCGRVSSQSWVQSISQEDRSRYMWSALPETLKKAAKGGSGNEIQPKKMPWTTANAVARAPMLGLGWLPAMRRSWWWCYGGPRMARDLPKATQSGGDDNGENTLKCVRKF